MFENLQFEIELRFDLFACVRLQEEDSGIELVRQLIFFRFEAICEETEGPRFVFKNEELFSLHRVVSEEDLFSVDIPPDNYTKGVDELHVVLRRELLLLPDCLDFVDVEKETFSAMRVVNHSFLLLLVLTVDVDEFWEEGVPDVGDEIEVCRIAGDGLEVRFLD